MLGLVFFVAAPAASADLGICGPGAGAGQCGSPQGVAADGENGEVYVADRANNRIDVFEADGTFLEAFGWGVADGTTAALQSCTASCFKGLPGSGAGQLSGPSKIAVDNDPASPAHHDVYVYDASNNRVEKFDPSGAFLFAFGKGVNTGTSGNADLCTNAGPPTDVCGAGSQGPGAGQLDEKVQLALGPGGVVYVADSKFIKFENNVNFYDKRVQKFDPTGSFAGQLALEAATPGSTTALAVDSAGDSYLATNSGNGAVRKYDPAGTPLATVNPSFNINAIAVDAAGSLFVGDNTGGTATAIYEYNSAATLVRVFYGSGTLQDRPVSLAPYSDAGGDIFAAEAGGVFHIGFGAAGPVVLPGEAGAVGNTKATLGAKVNPEGKETHAHFEYVDEATYEKDIGELGPGHGFDHAKRVPGSEGEDPITGSDFKLHTASAEAGCPVASEETVTEGKCLVPETAYRFRAAAKNADGGPNGGPEGKLTTLAPFEISATWATEVGTDTAKLHATVNPLGIAASAHFEYVDEATYEKDIGELGPGHGFEEAKSSAPINLGSGEEALTAVAQLYPLQPGTAYHYRIAVGDFFVAKAGPERVLRTPPPPPQAGEGCPNAQFRDGASAQLPDCRAYELVSPLDKNNGDVIAVEGITSNGLGYDLARLDQATPGGDGLAYSSYRAFGEVDSSPFTSEYIAERDPGAGWSSRALNPSREGPSLYAHLGKEIQFKAFSEELCSGWVLQDADLALAPGAPPGAPNLYRRDNCGEGGYELLTTTSPPGFGVEEEPASSEYYPEIQGFSADQSISVLRADAALGMAPGGPAPPLRCEGGPVGEGIAITYQWLRNGAPIGGATASSYIPQGADQGTAIQCGVSASGAEGGSLAVSKASIIGPAPPTSPPGHPGATVTGTPKVGETLSCSPGIWSNGPAFAYQWYRNGTPIGSAAAPAYTLLSADKGSAVQCQVTGANAAGAVIADSAADLLVGAQPPSAGADPAISGTPSLGETLNCSPGTWSNSPAFSYQWLRGSAPIIGATASTHIIVAADQGKALQCRVSAASADATAQATTARVVVAPPPGTAPPGLMTVPTVSGTAQAGSTLTCNSKAGDWSGSPTSLSIKWLRNGAVIGGETEPDYELKAADLGKAIQCQVSATNAGGIVVAINAAVPGGMRYVDPNPPAASAEALNLFQVYVADEGGQLRLGSVLPDGEAASGHSSAGTAQGGRADFRRHSIYHALSADGSRLFWSETADETPVNKGGGGGGPGKLYVRLNPTEAESPHDGAGNCIPDPVLACTIAITAADSRFWAADPAGTKALYTSGENLYEFDVEEEESTLLAHKVRGLLGASEDLARVYLVSGEVLDEGAGAGAANIYLLEGGAFRFVATLSKEDFAAVSAFSSVPFERLARVSPDGQRATFVSRAGLTGYDNTDASSPAPCGEAEGICDAEVYLYDATAGGGGELRCVSCNPSGARPAGRDLTPNSSGTHRFAAAQIPGWEYDLHPSRVLAADGKRLFFESFEALVARDTNGRKDVYEWERAGGAKGCEEAGAELYVASAGGCLSLISSGQSAQDSGFIDASASGNDVFFATLAGLLPQDYGLIDIYDARVGGGFPVPGFATECEGEACQSPPAPPDDPTPSSSTFEGQGNLPSAPGKGRCPKGKRKVHKAGKARCAAKKQKRHHGKAGR